MIWRILQAVRIFRTRWNRNVSLIRDLVIYYWFRIHSCIISPSFFLVRLGVCQSTRGCCHSHTCKILDNIDVWDAHCSLSWTLEAIILSLKEGMIPPDRFANDISSSILKWKTRIIRSLINIKILGLFWAELSLAGYCQWGRTGCLTNKENDPMREIRNSYRHLPLH